MAVTPTREQTLRYIRGLEESRPLLEAIREREIRETSTYEAILMFEEAFRKIQRELPERKSSGLVEWQKYMMKWRERDR